MPDTLRIKEIDTRHSRFISQRVAEQSAEWSAQDGVLRFRESIQAAVIEISRAAIRHPDASLTKAIEVLDEYLTWAYTVGE
jgi:hypothetical protein